MMTPRHLTALGLVPGLAITLMLAAGAAPAAIITVPGDAASLPEAVEIAQDGDTIWCLGDLIAGVQYTDLGRKRLTLYAGEFDQTLEEFRTGNAGAIWTLPDGTLLYGDGFQLRGLFRIRDGGETAAISLGRFVSEAEAFTVGEGARFDLLMFSGDEIEFNGPLRLEAGSTLLATGSFEPVRFQLGGTLEMEPGSRLVAGQLELWDHGQLHATDAELEVVSISGDEQGSLLWMSGGELRAESFEGWPGTVRLDGVDVFAEGTFQQSNISGDFVMRDSSFVSTDGLTVHENGSGDAPIPTLERVTISVEDLRFEGRAIFSGAVEASTVIDHGADLRITGESTFYGHARNEGLITVLDGDLLFLGGLDNNGSIVFDTDGSRQDDTPTLRVISGLLLRLDSSLVMPAGGRVVIAGSFDAFTRPERGEIRLGGAEFAILPAAGDAGDRQTIEAFSADLGPSERGFDTSRPDTSPIGTVRITSTVNGEFVNERFNQPRSQGLEAVYVDTLIVEAGAGLTSDTVNVYYRTLIADGGLGSNERFIRIGECDADLAEPYGTFDLADITAFVGAFADQRPAADYRAPFGVLDLNDLVGFLEAAAGDGCVP